jgi:glutaredoxin
MKQALIIIALLVAGVFAGRGIGYIYNNHVHPQPQGVVEGNFADIAPSRPVLFMSSTCPFCKKAVAYLDSEHIAYDKVVIDTSAAARERFERLGLPGVPVVVTKSVRIFGYKPDEYRKYLSSKG